MILHSNIIGEGKPFVILHGYLGMGDNWKSLGSRFAEHGYQIHLVDQRNHGRSFHNDEFSYEFMAGDLYAYCKFHKLKNIVLLGHSMGGKAAMLFAVTYPALVRKLLVADISPKYYPMHHHEVLKALSMLDFSEIKSRSEAEHIVSDYIKEAGIRLFLLKNLYWKHKGELSLRINLPVLIRKNEEVGKPLAENTVFFGETLFLRGEKSAYVEKGDEVLIRKHFPNSEIKTISNAGHWLHVENPEKFYEYVMNFL